MTSLAYTFIHKARALIRRGSVVPAFFDVTSKCNLRCPHCYFFRGEQPRDLTLAEWETIFQQCRADHITHAVLSGGEPTLRMDVIRLANQYFPILNIATNGLIPVPDDIKHTILISLDGPETTHDAIRGKGMFQRVLDNYRGDKRVITRMTIHKRNLDDIETVAHIAKQNDVRGVSFIVHAPHVSSGDELTLTRGELAEVKARLLALIRQYGTFIYLTPKVVDAMVYSKFAEKCKLRGSVALYSDGTSKKCTMNNIDCPTCKCPTPALLHVYRTDIQSALLGLKFY